MAIKFAMCLREGCALCWEEGGGENELKGNRGRPEETDRAVKVRYKSSVETCKAPRLPLGP